jgi:high-affinity iron transporter
MLASALIVFREVFEAGLVLGIVLSATRGVAGRGRWVTGGVLGGLLGACLVAMFAGAIGEAMQGSGQEVFNAGILLIAAVMLGWHNVWMARHGREMAGEMKALGRSVSEGSRTLLALAVVVGVAILREGSEVVLFLYGLAAGGEGGVALIGGCVLGLLGGGAVAALLYRGLVSIPTRQLFRVTNVMLSLLAAGMAAQAVGFLIQADLLPALGTQVWNSSALLDEKSIAGRALHALVGYTDRPAGLQLVVYGLTLAALLIAGRAVTPQGAPRQAGGTPQRV